MIREKGEIRERNVKFVGRRKYKDEFLTKCYFN